MLEFGRYAVERRKRRGARKPETFDFLGFTHIGGRSRAGQFLVHRKTIKKRLRLKLQQVKTELRRRWHDPVPEVGQWLHRVVQGYYNYHAVPGNSDRVQSFRTAVVRLWLRTLRRRSQRRTLTWKRFAPLATVWIPYPRVLHPYPNVRFAATHPR